jgi:hypothetical protein
VLHSERYQKADAAVGQDLRYSRSSGIVAPYSETMRTRSLPLAYEKYPASKTTLSRGTALLASCMSVIRQFIVLCKKENPGATTSAGFLDLLQP